MWKLLFFKAGIFVSLLFIIWAQLYQQEIAALEKHEEKTKSNIVPKKNISPTRNKYQLSTFNAS